MNQAKSVHEEWSLVSGKRCQLLRVRNAWIPRYYLMVFPKTQGHAGRDH